MCCRRELVKMGDGTGTVGIVATRHIVHTMYELATARIISQSTRIQNTGHCVKKERKKREGKENKNGLSF